jgi:hypothetical protein
MRMMSLVFSFVVTVSLATVALVYLEHRIGQNRIAVQDGWIAAEEPKAYQAYGDLSSTDEDSLAKLVADQDSAAGR